MKRPFAVTTLLWMVLFLVTWNTIRAFAALDNWTVLKEFAPRPGPVYIFISASFWAVSGFALWRALRHRRVTSARKPLAYLLGYALWWWADRLIFSGPGVNWPFTLSLTLLLCAFTIALSFHPRTKEYFTQRETHDHNPPD